MNLKEASRGVWHSHNVPTYEDIRAGSFQRMADAMELMARDRSELEADLEWHKKALVSRNARRDALLRSNAALRGVITKLKAKIAEVAK
jgi:hypothetical protein